MARSPRARVSLTSGQGVSRLSYQRSRALAGRDDAPQAEGKFSTASNREYAKGKAKSEYKASMNVSYGDTYGPTDLQDVAELAGLKPPKSRVADKREPSKRLK